MQRLKSKRGNLGLDYATLFAAAGLALFAMTAYITNAISDKMRTEIDSFGHGRLYEPTIITR